MDELVKDMDFENNVYSLIKELNQFDYRIESIDHIWEVIFPDQKNNYHHIRVTKYHEVFYIIPIDGDLCTLEVTPKKSVKVASSFGRTPYDDGSNDPARVWTNLVIYARKWLKVVNKDWIKANKQVHELYPHNRRYGIVSNSLVRTSLADIYRIDKELGKAKTKKFISLVEDMHFFQNENTTVDSMTANDFFKYCKIAYLAGKRKDDYVDENLSGREMYESYADGRHEGLLDIDADSKQEFADWIDGKHAKKTSGGHPWEIKRGGNTTHIDLYVSRPNYYKNEGFTLKFCAASIGRLKETIYMFLAVYEAGLPISIANPEGIRKRLLAHDNVGIIPCFHSLHRANQHFHERQDVFDVLYYDDLVRYKRRIKPFITWEPLPILKPTNISAN